MIIPIKCFTCGSILADKYRHYQEQVRMMKLNNGSKINKTVYLSSTNMDKTPEGIVLDQLYISRPCCRIRMLTHVDID